LNFVLIALVIVSFDLQEIALVIVSLELQEIALVIVSLDLQEILTCLKLEMPLLPFELAIDL
jgi:hypothetical protein